MPIIDRINWATRQDGMGRMTHIIIGPARDPGKLKLRIVLEPVEAASMDTIAQQGVRDVRVIETGSEVIAVQTIDIIHATNKELQDTVEMVLTVMNSALKTDMTNLLLMSLSQKHNLQLNMPTVQELLL